MQTINVYIYPNVVEIQLPDEMIFDTRTRPVYNRTAKVYQGIDNPIQVLIKNQDQKPIDITGKFSIQVDIQDPVNNVTVNSYAVTFPRPEKKGMGMFVIDQATLDNMELRYYKLTFKAIDLETNTERPAYIDDDYNVPIDIMVFPAYHSTMMNDLEDGVVYASIIGGEIE